MPHTLLVGMLNGAAALENNLAFPQKVKHRVAIQPGSSRLGKKKKEITCSNVTEP